MKVLAVSHTGLMSGAERVLLGQLEHFKSLGHSVTLACAPGPLAAAAALIGIETATIPELKPGTGPRPIAMFGLARTHARAARPLRKLAAPMDVVVFNSFLALPATGGVHLGPPTGLFVHDVMIRPDRKAVLRLFRRTVDRAFAVSGAAGAYPKLLGIDTRIVRNGARITPRHPDQAFRDRSIEPVVIGIVGALTPWKGHLVLLEAMKQLPAIHLEILGAPFPGDRAHAEELRRRAEDSELADRVHFLGHQEDVAAVMGRWSASISSSIEPEAGPLVVLEAMALGIPIVATSLGGVLEVLGDAGALVPPNDATSLAEAVRELLSDDDHWRRCSQAGFTTVTEWANLKTSLDEAAKELEALGALPRRQARRGRRR